MDDLSQKTIKTPISFSGRGLFTGKQATVFLYPAPPDYGVVFRRKDIPGEPTVKACLESVFPCTRCTALGKFVEKPGETEPEPLVQTVEHLLAALRALQIANIQIDIDGPEIPIFDGSSLPFLQKIQEAGLATQEASQEVFVLEAPVFWSQGDMHLVALPASEYRISYTLSYPQSPYLSAQYYSCVLAEESFTKEIAPCRTFSLYEEIEPLIQKGFFVGGGLENGVVIKGQEVLNPEGVRFSNEMVRHKILDIIGDLSLVPYFFAHIIAIRSGHAANYLFGQELRKALKRRVFFESKK